MPFKFAVLFSALILLGGCANDPRPESLRAGLAQTRILLQKPEIVKLAEKQKGSPEQRRVAALFSVEGHPFWPPSSDREYLYAVPTPEHWPNRIILLNRPDAPWCVAVQADPNGDGILLAAYGATLDKPLFTERMKLAGPAKQ